MFKKKCNKISILNGQYILNCQFEYEKNLIAYRYVGISLHTGDLNLRSSNDAPNVALTI